MLVQTAAPSAEPILLADARKHLRLTAADSTLEDSLIELWIAAARRHAEAETGLSLITQTWRQVMDYFPRCIELERGPVQSISALTYRNMAGATQTVSWDAAANSLQRSTDGTLVADLSGSDARIHPAFGSTWPVAMPEIGAIAVTYTAGYGTSGASVPEGIRSWMLLRIGMLYEHREEVAEGQLMALPYIDRLLDPYRVVRA